MLRAGFLESRNHMIVGNSLIPLRLSFLICKMGMAIVSSSQGYWGDYSQHSVCGGPGARHAWSVRSAAASRSQWYFWTSFFPCFTGEETEAQRNTFPKILQGLDCNCKLLIPTPDSSQGRPAFFIQDSVGRGGGSTGGRYFSRL